MSKEAVDRLREKAQNEQTVIVMNAMLNAQKAELTKLREFKAKVLALEPVGYAPRWKTDGSVEPDMYQSKEHILRYFDSDDCLWDFGIASLYDLGDLKC